MHLEVVTPDKKVFEGEVDSAKFPGTKGAFQVLKNHAPIISTLERGVVSYRNKEGEHNIPIDGGIVEVLNNRIIVLAESAG